MGKSRKNGPKTRNENSRKELLKQRNLDTGADLQLELLNSDRITGDQIKLYNETVLEFPENNVENPLFILDNVELMKTRLEYFKLSMSNFINKNNDSVTDNMSELLTNNKYVIYVQTILDIV